MILQINFKPIQILRIGIWVDVIDRVKQPTIKWYLTPSVLITQKFQYQSRSIFKLDF